MALSNYLPYNFMLTQITGTPIVPVICGSIFAAGKGRIFMQTRNRQFVSVLIGAFIYAVSMVSLVKPVHIAPGGATGVALMLNYLFGLPVGAMSFFVNVPLLAAAWKTLGPRFVLKTTATVLLCSFFMDKVAAVYFPVYAGPRFLGALLGGAISGIGITFLFKAECTTGGADILAFIIHKYFPQLSMGRIFFYLNALVLVSSIFVFREIWAGFYGVVCLTATSKILDFLLICLNQSR